MVVASNFLRTNIEGGLLGVYSGNMPLDQKFDITYEPGYIRGRWITIVDERNVNSLSSHPYFEHSLTLAEVRVYGSK